MGEFPCGDSAFFIDGAAGRLEAVAACPAPEQERALTAVVCHPNPLQGGTLQNKVVYTVARAFNELGGRSVRFNFRGVGRSAGAYGEGAGETEDALAVLAWVRQRRPQDAVWLAGFSFGAYVALRAAALFPVAGLVTVAPAVDRYDVRSVPPPRVPWLLVQGEADEVVPAARVTAWAANLAPGPELVLLPDSGHYFHRRLNELRAAVVEGLRPHLRQDRDRS